MPAHLAQFVERERPLTFSARRKVVEGVVERLDRQLRSTLELVDHANFAMGMRAANLIERVTRSQRLLVAGHGLCVTARQTLDIANALMCDSARGAVVWAAFERGRVVPQRLLVGE